MGNPKRELCTMRIVFPIDSDEEAIEYKRKVATALDNKEDAQIQFSIVTMTPKPLRDEQNL